MRFRLVPLLAWLGLAVLAAHDLPLPPRPPGAETGTAFAARVAALDVEKREAAVLAAVAAGNVPAFWRHFVPVRIGAAVVHVAPDYLAVGDDGDYLLLPLRPATAQALADRLECVLPTPKLVDAIYQAAPLHLSPRPIPPSAAMTTLPVFAAHNALVQTQRQAELAAYPLGTLVAGHKKDVVITPRLALQPDRLAIYGWHRGLRDPIQPLYLGHAASWVDYSHGIRLVQRVMTWDGVPTTVEAVLADATRSATLSDEGPLVQTRYGGRALAVFPRLAEKTEEQRLEGGIRVGWNLPEPLDPAKPVQLVIYAAPAGNSIEQTLGHRVAAGDDWHFDIQHIAAQTRWLRTRLTDRQVVLACIQAEEKSFVLWRRKHADYPARCVAAVDTLHARFPSARLVLAAHSAGGSFVFGYLDGMEQIPSDVERVVLLDSNYAYDGARGHATKLATWLTGPAQPRLCVLAYQDYLALLDGKTFVSEAGGTWGRSQAMLRDLAAFFPITRHDEGGLQRHGALDQRVEFLLKENPEKAVLHTRQVELNGFIHGLLSGTLQVGRDYVYLGPRVYSDLISEP
jgi:hypothetical protein